MLHGSVWDIWLAMLPGDWAGPAETLGVSSCSVGIGCRHVCIDIVRGFGLLIALRDCHSEVLRISPQIILFALSLL